MPDGSRGKPRPVEGAHQSNTLMGARSAGDNLRHIHSGWYGDGYGRGMGRVKHGPRLLTIHASGRTFAA